MPAVSKLARMQSEHAGYGSITVCPLTWRTRTVVKWMVPLAPFGSRLMMSSNIFISASLVCGKIDSFRNPKMLAVRLPASVRGPWVADSVRVVGLATSP